MKKTLLLFFAINSLTLFAQFPSINWQFYTGAPAFGSAAAADLDNDGFYEIVFTTYTNDGHVHCLNAEDGTERWNYYLGGCSDVAPIIYDVDNDDTLDVICNGSCNPTMFCFNGYTGQLKWSRPSGGGDSPPTIADMDGDSLAEIFFCTFGGELRVYNGEDGTTDKIIQVDNGPIETEPTLVDVDNNGRLDIIMANHYNVTGLYVWAYDYITEDTIWTNYLYDTSSTYNAYHGGAVADVDGDGLLEYVIGSNNGMIRALNIEDGTTRWTRLIPMSNMAPVSIADLDGNGDLEVVVTNNDWVTFDERIWVLDGLTGNTEWSYATTFSSFRGCAIADINGNDTLDLVAGYFMGDVIAVEPYNGLIWQTNLLSQFPPNLPYFEVDHGPLVADFDHSGTMDVFVVGGYGTYTPDSQNTGKAFMIEAGTGQCPEWLMFRQDIHRSGYLSAADAAASCSFVQSVEETAETTIPVYPNPAGDKIVIGNPPAGNYTVRIYSSTGALVLEQMNYAEVDVSLFAAGVYSVEVQSQEQISRQKLVIAR